MTSVNSEVNDRRLTPRIKKNYIIRFADRQNPALKYEVSQIENISKGGLCFSSGAPFKANTLLSVELRTPYMAESVFIEGHILESREKIKGLIYENRFKFSNIDPRALDVLNKIEQYNLTKRV